MTLPGFVNEEDQLADGKRIQRQFSHSYELPLPTELESAPGDAPGAGSRRKPSKGRARAARKGARRRRLIRRGEPRDAAGQLKQR